MGHQNCDRRQALAPSRQSSHVLFDSRTTRVSPDVLLSAVTYSNLATHHSAPWAMIHMLTVSRTRVACEHLALLDRPTNLVELATSVCTVGIPICMDGAACTLYQQHTNYTMGHSDLRSAALYGSRNIGGQNTGNYRLVNYLPVITGNYQRHFQITR